MAIPLMAAGAAVGIGLQAYGAISGSGAAKEKAEAEKRINQQEMLIEQQRRKAMELDARRKQLEIFRNAQRARAMALTVATSQGATGPGSSGLMGAYGQIAGQTGVNSLGINQNLQIGRTIFDHNAIISQEKMKIADAGSRMATAQGYSQLGGSIFSASMSGGGLMGGVNFGGGGTPSMSSYGGFTTGIGGGGIY